ncbi:MAG: DUF6326 family protein, partial [Pseudomonadota bacterium]
PSAHRTLALTATNKPITQPTIQSPIDMNTNTLNTRLITIDRRHLASSLWIFICLNVLFRDIHDLVKADTLEDILAGTLYGNPVTETALLFGGFAVITLCAMAILSAALTHSANRLLNMVFAPLIAIASLFNMNKDLDDLAHLSATVIATGVIVAVMATWRKAP